MNSPTERPLIERLQDYSETNVDPHEVSREISRLCQSQDAAGLKALREAYIGKFAQKGKTDSEVTFIVDDNLYIAALMADYTGDQQEASGVLTHSCLLRTNPNVSAQKTPTALFYSQTTGYLPPRWN